MQSDGKTETQRRRRKETYTLKGSLGSEARMILKETLFPLFLEDLLLLWSSGCKEKRKAKHTGTRVGIRWMPSSTHR